MFEHLDTKTIFIGKNTQFLATCHSTNDFAMQMIQKQYVFDGTVIITNNQTKGRGQRGNDWEAEAGQNLTLSIILQPKFLNIPEQFNLNIAISLGVINFLALYIDEGLSIKWPNDLYFKNQKIGGILIENTVQGQFINYSIIGIGLNINQLYFKNERATSIRKINQQPFLYDLQEMYVALIQKIESYYLKLKQNQFIFLKDEYLQKLYLINQEHRFERNEQDFVGKIIGVNEKGKLSVEIDGDIVDFNLKEITYL